MEVSIKSAENGFVLTEGSFLSSETYVYATPGEVFAHLYRRLPGSVVSNRDKELRGAVDHLYAEESRGEEDDKCDPE